MLLSQNIDARTRLESLLLGGPGVLQSAPDAPTSASRSIREVEGFLAKRIYYAGMTLSPSVICSAQLAIASLLAALGSMLFPSFLIPCLFVVGAYMPLAWLNRRADSRATEFSLDYSTVLLATAASIKTGMTAQLALERAVRLLEPENVVRREVERFLDQLRAGMPREKAIAQFAASIRLPDLDLFRSAFLLVLENGGRFGPTLERLANVSKDRSTLVSSAATSTATMRMTANVLLAVAPFLLFIISLRTENFWELLLEHPTANLIASIGFTLIAGGYGLLRHMSNFKA